jgi:hypothetical protein
MVSRAWMQWRQSENYLAGRPKQPEAAGQRLRSYRNTSDWREFVFFLSFSVSILLGIIVKNEQHDFAKSVKGMNGRKDEGSTTSQAKSRCMKRTGFISPSSLDTFFAVLSV